MNKSASNEQLLSEVSKRLEDGRLAAGDLQALLQRPAAQHKPEQEPVSQVSPTATSTTLLTRLLFIIGGVFITLGMIYLVSQIWDDLGTAARILITLGAGIVFAATGSWFMIRDAERELGTVLHAIGGFMVPGGAMITLDEMGVSFESSWPVTLTIGMVFCFYLILTWYHQRVILNFFCFANGTALAYLLTDSLLPTADGDVYDYLTMCIGASYIIYAQLFREDWNMKLAPLLLFFGPVGFYGAAFSQIFDHFLMEMLFPFLAFGGMVLSVNFLRSRLTLTISTLAVIAYIVYFTAEYFADSIGWPVALIVLGFAIIGTGYFSISLNRKYLKPES